jgi:hypothetical protein
MSFFTRISYYKQDLHKQIMQIKHKRMVNSGLHNNHFLYPAISMKTRLTVDFYAHLPIPQIIDEIAHLTSPHVFLWYFGPYGLKKAGVDFYKKNLISPLLAHRQLIFWLMDLTAWGAFRDRHVPITEVSSLAEEIENFSIPQIHCMNAADIFKKMEALDPASVAYFQKALRRGFIHKSSENAPTTDIPLHSILTCPVISEWSNHDASKCYSTLQYLEGCLLIEEIVQKSSLREVEIVFILPNDELKYYQDETNAFQQDVAFLVEKYGKSVRIKFYSFQYGEQEQHRPYNAPGKVYKKNELTCEDIRQQPGGV